MQDEDGLDDRCDARGAAAELSQEAPALQGGHGLFADAADLGGRAVVPTLPPLEATAPKGHLDGAVDTWIRLVGPALEAGLGECFDDAVTDVVINLEGELSPSRLRTPSTGPSFGHRFVAAAIRAVARTGGAVTPDATTPPLAPTTPERRSARSAGPRPSRPVTSKPSSSSPAPSCGWPNCRSSSWAPPGRVRTEVTAVRGAAPSLESACAASSRKSGQSRTSGGTRTGGVFDVHEKRTCARR